MKPFREWVPVPSCTLEQHVANLVRQGLKPEAEEFQTLFRVFGEEKIREMARKAYVEQRGPA